MKEYESVQTAFSIKVKFDSSVNRSYCNSNFHGHLISLHKRIFILHFTNTCINLRFVLTEAYFEISKPNITDEFNHRKEIQLA